MTYLLLNGAILAIIIAVAYAARKRIAWRTVLLLMAVLLVFTVVFDSLIVGTGIVAYDASKILGVYIAKAPLEDFAYTIAACLLVPLLWERGERHKRKDGHAKD